MGTRDSILGGARMQVSDPRAAAAAAGMCRTSSWRLEYELLHFAARDFVSAHMSDAHNLDQWKLHGFIRHHPHDVGRIVCHVLAYFRLVQNHRDVKGG